jgi:hypothetical protein
LVESNSGKDWRRWGEVKADIFGIDCDGVRPTRLPYTNYESETETALLFLEEFAHNGYKWFAVPEFGCPRIPSADPDGSIRAGWHEFYNNLWAKTGKCRFVTLYEYNLLSDYYNLTTPAEIEQFRAWV